MDTNEMENEPGEYEPVVADIKDEDAIDTNPLNCELGSIMYEMTTTLENEFREGSTQRLRDDTFAIYFEQLFGVSIDDIDNVEEEIISRKNSELYINAYKLLVESISNLFDKYYGITFYDEVDLNLLHDVYIAVYVQYFDFLTKYAIGKNLVDTRSRKTVNELIGQYRATARKTGVAFSKEMIGRLIANEDEFNPDNIAVALDVADPGNEMYLEIFGSPSVEGENPEEEEALSKVPDSPKVFINSEAFRLRILMEFDYENDIINHMTFETTICEYADKYDQ